jgi:hypothetical protein
MPGSGAMTGTSRVGAAVVAGPTGTVGWGTAVGAARYGVAGAGAAVWAAGRGDAPVCMAGAVSLVGIGSDDASITGVSGTGFSAGAYTGDTGANRVPDSSRAAAIPAIVMKTSANNTTSDRLSDSAFEVRTILIE